MRVAAVTVLILSITLCSDPVIILAINIYYI